MSLRQQILAVPETLSDIVWAAQQRFSDAQTLLPAGQFTGAIYFFGLASEMWLKSACLRLRGVRPTDQVWNQLAPARTWMTQQLTLLHRTPISHEAYHSLIFWSELLIVLNAARGTPMPRRVAGALRHHIRRLFEDWHISMRYAAITPSAREARRVYNDTVWLRDNWVLLGR